ncbi:hypothetical protein F4805DRAFT_472491 [Annulohypoxylon moriforme]|nr:hypothetical protein F4805DRAFT_472491 [Annulohypoxylon moriforme]
MALQGDTEMDKPAGANQPYQLQQILRNIDELTEQTLSLYDTIEQSQHATTSSDGSPKSQSELLNVFKDMMIAIQRKTSKAVYEVETKLEVNFKLGNSYDIPDTSLVELAGIDPESEWNRVLGRKFLDDKQCYKLRYRADVPSPRLIVDGDTTALPPVNPEYPCVVLQPTLRNVWVIQHAYARVLEHKEQLIEKYTWCMELNTRTTRKFAREYYEVPSLINLPSKHKLGNLLDVKCSSYNQTTHDLMVVLLFPNFEGSRRYMEPVTQEDVSRDGEFDKNSYLVLPVCEATIKMLYDTYRSLRTATSEQRRATRDKEFAANLPVDAIDELEKRLDTGSIENLDEENGGNRKRRRRMSDDEGTSSKRFEPSPATYT